MARTPVISPRTGMIALFGDDHKLFLLNFPAISDIEKPLNVWMRGPLNTNRYVRS